MKFITTTPKGTEGNQLSYNTEKECAETLETIVPKDWKVEFNWYQIFFQDVSYKIDKEEKTVFIGYNQNLAHWWNDIRSDIEFKLKELDII